MGLFTFNFDLGKWTLPFFGRKPKVVLVVEDDPETIGLIRRAATSMEYQVESADTAEEALGILHANGRRFVLAMIDVGLPGMGGWELAQQIHDVWPKLRVTVMSGAPESFHSMPKGRSLSVMIKPANYGEFFQSL